MQTPSMDFMQSMGCRYRRPVVIVQSSTCVENASRRNGLDFIQLLRPYTVCSGTLYARPVDRGDAISVKHFGVRLVRLECVQEVSRVDLLQNAKDIMREAASVELAYGEQIDRALLEIPDSRYGGGPKSRPVRLSSSAAVALLEHAHPHWHTHFVRSYQHLVRCSPFDTLDYPVGAIFVASTREENGINGIVKLFQGQVKRLSESRGSMLCMEEEVHFYYILVHDVTDVEGPSIIDARRMLGELQSIYGQNYCAMIKINTVANPQETKNLDPSPWIEANESFLDVPSAVSVSQTERGSSTPSGKIAGSSSAGAGDTTGASPTLRSPLRFPSVHAHCGKWPEGGVRVTGCHLAPTDVQEITNVMTYYLAQALFPFLEKRFRVLSISVQERRTTTLSKVAAWFKGKDEVKPRAEVYVAPQERAAPIYLSSSLEMQMRRCGDLALAFQDYEHAVNFYKLCRDELLETVDQRPFNWPLIAACQEGIGVSQYFQGKLVPPSLAPATTGQTRNSSQSHACRFEIAMNDYLAAGNKTYALRMALTIFEFCRTRTPPMMDRANAVLQHVLRAGLVSDSTLLTAVVHHMIAGVYLFLNPPRPAGMPVSSVLPAQMPVHTYLRCFARHLVLAGSSYLEDGVLEMSLYCYLRALAVFRQLGLRGHWSHIFEHIVTLVAYIHNRLGNEAKSIAMASMAITQGAPMYSNQLTGLRNFQVYWERQKHVLDGIGFSICPHMTTPCVVRSSFAVLHNSYHADRTSKDDAKTLGEVAVESEWRVTEDELRRYYQVDPTLNKMCRFPKYSGDLTECCLFPRPAESVASSSCPQRATLSPAAHHRHFTVSMSEPLMLCFDLRNPVGSPLISENFCILYMSTTRPGHLWKSPTTVTVQLGPRESRRVELAFTPVAAGEYVIVGLCWSLQGQEGYYYFATKESREGCLESLYEYAVEHPSPSLEAEDNIHVTVTAPQAWVTADIDPPLPCNMRDGEYFHTKLRLTNRSEHCDASHIMLQRSPNNAHVVWLPDFSLEDNLQVNASLPVADKLKAKSTLSIPFTIRAQHNRVASQRCSNQIFFLLGYISSVSTLAQPSDDSSALKECSLAIPSTTPIARLHRVLRRFEVRPMMALYSTTLPPANASLAIAAVVTAKNIAAAGCTQLHVSRVSVMHRRHWSVGLLDAGSAQGLYEQACTLLPASSLCIPLQICRQRPESSLGVSAGGEALCQSDEDFSDADCLSFSTTGLSHEKRSLVTGNVGPGLASTPMNQYFLRTSFRGPGSIGLLASPEGGLHFYLDRGGKPKTEQEILVERCEAERRTFGGTLERYTPLVVAVTWTVMEANALVSGQLFHFMDPMSFLFEKVPADTDVGGPKQNLRPLITDSASSYSEVQEQLCTSMVRCASAHPRMGAFAFHVRAPPLIEAIGTLSAPAVAKLQFCCQSFFPTPLLVEVAAGITDGAPTEHVDLPLVFVGKTKYCFPLPPSGSHTLSFSAHILIPGLVNCNRFRVTATPMLSQSHHQVQGAIAQGPGAKGKAAGSAPPPHSNGVSIHDAVSSPFLPSTPFIRESVARCPPAVSSVSTTALARSGEETLHRSGNSDARFAESLAAADIFLSSDLVIVGHDSLATTEVRFTLVSPQHHVDDMDSSSDVKKSSREAWKQFELGYRQFERLQVTTATEGEESSRKVFRPPVQSYETFRRSSYGNGIRGVDAQL